MLKEREAQFPRTAPLAYRLRHYAASVILVWVAIYFYRHNHYYQGFLGQQTQFALLYLAGVYTGGALLFYVLAPFDQMPQSKAYITLRSFWRLISGGSKTAKGRRRFAITETERVSIFFLVVKLFFLPMMINFLIGNFHDVTSNAGQLSGVSSIFTISTFNQIIYPLLFGVILFVDTAYFTFGYVVETRLLHSTVRSVEPTVLGWVVVLACYPPFNGTTGTYIPWYANDQAYFGSPELTFVMRILVLVLMGIYAWASVALGAKCSNLTNRGIVSRGPYAVVRHPAYAAKNAAWWVTVLPVLSAPAMLAMSAWSGIYYLRSVTEERHLLRDPDYVAYSRKVRYRFLPGLYRQPEPGRDAGSKRLPIYPGRALGAVPRVLALVRK